MSIYACRMGNKQEKSEAMTFVMETLWDSSPSWNVVLDIQSLQMRESGKARSRCYALCKGSLKCMELCPRARDGAMAQVTEQTSPDKIAVVVYYL